ncbi:MAG: hypothetical protein V2I54_02410 [Bacteroidales bacterium]|jgi:hypothetical protein|nr:hypothetical protein [Bacteroidales bacterium]
MRKKENIFNPYGLNAAAFSNRNLTISEKLRDNPELLHGFPVITSQAEGMG